MIDPAKPEDAPAIHRIAQDAGVFSSQEVLCVGEMLDAFFDPSPTDDFVFLVARNGGRAVTGFICYGPTSFADRIWEVYWICVERRHQRNHVAQELMGRVYAEVCAKSARALYLETSDSTDYAPARAFYLRQGFECVAHLNDFYKQGEGKVIYRRTLEA
jgi:ribosomal protein S18 acetylase RimI-like enzyme